MSGDADKKEILTVTWNDDDEDAVNIVTLTADRNVLFDLKACPPDPSLSGWPLVEALSARGARLNDTVDKAGLTQHAWRAVDRKTGNVKFLGHMVDGRYQNTADGEAAIMYFDAITGHLTGVSHYKAGERQDPAPGWPAQQKFDPLTGRTIYARHFDDGHPGAELSPEALLILDAFRKRPHPGMHLAA